MIRNNNAIVLAIFGHRKSSILYKEKNLSEKRSGGLGRRKNIEEYLLTGDRIPDTEFDILAAQKKAFSFRKCCSPVWVDFYSMWVAVPRLTHSLRLSRRDRRNIATPVHVFDFLAKQSDLFFQQHVTSFSLVADLSEYLFRLDFKSVRRDSCFTILKDSPFLDIFPVGSKA